MAVGTCFFLELICYLIVNCLCIHDKSVMWLQCIFAISSLVFLVFYFRPPLRLMTISAMKKTVERIIPAPQSPEERNHLFALTAIV